MHTARFTNYLRTICALCALLLAILYSGIAQNAGAQLSVPGQHYGALIELEPRRPQPNQTFTARLANYSNDMSNNTVTWYVNGEAQEQATNQTTVTLSAPVLGTPIKIEARSRSISGGESKATLTFVPSTIDLIIEGGTTAPYFYEGRRVPTKGSTARISAIPHVFDTNGARIPSERLIFHWSVNDVLVKEGLAADVLDYPIPNLVDPNIALTVESTDGSVEYSTFTSLPLVEPSLEFYVHNPLSGLSQNAIQDSYIQTDTELSIRAEPYFISTSVYANAQHGWAVNETPVANGGNDPQLITLQKGRATGVSTVAFSLRNLSALSQYVAGIFNVDFN